MAEQKKELGKVIHYFDKAMVAVVRLSETVHVGDQVKFVHGEQETNEIIDSMEVDHKKVKVGKKGDEVAIKVHVKTHENARMYAL